MKSLAALTIALLATAASASPATVELKKRKLDGSYLKRAPDADRSRAALLKSRQYNGLATVPATNVGPGYAHYTTSVGIGNPPINYNLIVDTGSSNTFCGTDRPYVRTSTSIPTGETVNITYAIGFFTGIEYLDQVTLACDLVITNQSIGDALHSASFEGVDGILGLGPIYQTQGTLPSDMNATIPTVMNNLASQKLIVNQVVGVYFAPTTNENDTNGALTYGGIDSSLYEGEVTYAPVTTTQPSSLFWGINVTSCTYGNHTVIPVSTAGIIDSGTTLVLLANDYFTAYMGAIPGATFNSALGLIEIPKSSIPDMQPLDFLIADQVYTMDVAAQLIPTDENAAWGGLAEKQYGLVSNLNSTSGAGFDFIFGQKFMERYYMVFDTDAQRVGFAQTKNTFTVYQG